MAEIIQGVEGFKDVDAVIIMLLSDVGRKRREAYRVALEMLLDRGKVRTAQLRGEDYYARV